MTECTCEDLLKEANEHGYFPPLHSEECYLHNANNCDACQEEE